MQSLKCISQEENLHPDPEVLCTGDGQQQSYTLD